MIFHPERLMDNRQLEDIKGLYLNLMKLCLTNLAYWKDEVKSRPGEEANPCLEPRDRQAREEGRDWPVTAHTMIGLKRLDNLQYCVEEILKNNVPGDLLEAGVWRGGASIFMRALLKAHGERKKCVWVVDSFEGFPEPDAERYPQDSESHLHEAGELAVPIEEVKANFGEYGLLDAQVRFLKGLFRDTLPKANIKSLALMRLDGDTYEATINSLIHLYPKLSIGGYVIIDDYGAVPACRQAVNDFRDKYGVAEEICRIDWTGVYWKKEKEEGQDGDI